MSVQHSGVLHHSSFLVSSVVLCSSSCLCCRYMQWSVWCTRQAFKPATLVCVAFDSVPAACDAYRGAFLCSSSHSNVQSAPHPQTDISRVNECVEQPRVSACSGQATCRSLQALCLLPFVCVNAGCKCVTVLDMLSITTQIWVGPGAALLGHQNVWPTACNSTLTLPINTNPSSCHILSKRKEGGRGWPCMQYTSMCRSGMHRTCDACTYMCTSMCMCRSLTGSTAGIYGWATAERR
jgi:hypothetical protein